MAIGFAVDILNLKDGVQTSEFWIPQYSSAGDKKMKLIYNSYTFQTRQDIIDMYPVTVSVLRKIH